MRWRTLGINALVSVLIAIAIASAAIWKLKGGTLKRADARDIPHDLSDFKTTVAKLPEVREGSKASGLGPFIELTGRMMERMAAQTAEYEKKGTAENILRILQAGNMFDPAERAASRETIARVDRLRLEHERAMLAIIDDFLYETAALDMDPQTNADLLEAARTSHEKMAVFLRSQQALHAEWLEELLNILDLMDRAKGATLGDGRFMLATQRDVDDYHRSLDRMNRLLNVRQIRAEELKRNLPQMGEYTQDSMGASREFKRFAAWNPSSQSGARVMLDGQGITVDDKRIVLAIEKSELIKMLGQPREVVKGETVYCMWDDLGVGVAHKQGVSRITNLMVALRPAKNPDWPKQVVRGRLTLMGVDVDENSTPWSLNRKLKDGKFVCTDQAGKEYELVLDRYKVMTTFKVDGSIDKLYVSHLGRLGKKQD